VSPHSDKTADEALCYYVLIMHVFAQAHS
jgi:hypothetical protein